LDLPIRFEGRDEPHQYRSATVDKKSHAWQVDDVVRDLLLRNFSN
jgi:hypothetical protein